MIQAQVTYNPAVFDAPDLESARRIAVTPTDGGDTDERWARETPYLADLIGKELALRPGELVIDYGCGVGRIAKALIERFGVRVLGVDISEKMRGLAPAYAGSAAFSVVSRNVLEGLATAGLRADAAISVWVLQHSGAPADDLSLLSRALRPEARLAVVNNRRRAVPTREIAWVDDGLDIAAMLDGRFRRTAGGALDPAIVGPQTSRMTFWATYAV